MDSDLQTMVSVTLKITDQAETRTIMNLQSANNCSETRPSFHPQTKDGEEAPAQLCTL